MEVEDDGAQPDEAVQPGSNADRPVEAEATKRGEAETGELKLSEEQLRREIGSAKNHIATTLNNLQRLGTFAGSFRRLVNPRSPLQGAVTVNGVGTFDFPLKKAQARQIIAQMQPSPQNIKACALDASQISLAGNPVWWEHLHIVLVSMVSASMGITGGARLVRPMLRNMSVLGKGPSMEAHIDPPSTTPGVFGTAVIILPSKHTGGEIIIQNNNDSVMSVMEDDQSNSAMGIENKKKLTAIAWYRDVQHETKPVTSGYRWALTYDLVYTETLDPVTIRSIDEDGNMVVETLPDTVPTANAQAKMLKNFDFLVKRATDEWRNCMLDGRDFADEQTANWRKEFDASEAAYNEIVTQKTNLGTVQYNIWDTDVRTAAYRAARVWQNLDDPMHSVQHAVYPLQHSYEEESFSFKSLKTVDRHVVQVLRSLADEICCDVFLGFTRKTEQGKCENSYYPFRRLERARKKWEFPKNVKFEDPKDSVFVLDVVHSVKYDIRKLLDMDGNLITESIPLPPENLLTEIESDITRARQEQLYDNYGHGMECVHVYNVPSVILVPRYCVEDMLHSSLYGVRNAHKPDELERNLQTLIMYYATRSNDPEKDEDMDNFDLLASVCQYVWDRKPPPKYVSRTPNVEVGCKDPLPIQPDAALELVKASVRMREWEFLSQILKKANIYDSTAFFTWVYNELHSKTRPLSFDEAQPLLDTVACDIATMSGGLEAIQILSARPSEEEKVEGADEVLRDWANRTFESLLKQFFDKEGKAVSYEDGQALIQHTMIYYDRQYLLETLAPRLQKMACRTAFSLGVLSAIWKQILEESSSGEKQLWPDIYETLARRVVAEMEPAHLQSIDLAQKALDLTIEYRYLRKDAEVRRKALQEAIEAKWLAVFHDELLASKTPPLTELAGLLLEKISNEIAAWPEVPETAKKNTAASAQNVKNLTAINSLWLPLVGYFVQGHSLSLPPSESVRRLACTAFKSMLSLALSNYPVRNPSLARTWIDFCDRDAFGSGCKICHHFNKFLRSSTRSSICVRLVFRNRDHVLSQVRILKIDCKVEVAPRSTKDVLVTITKTWKQYGEDCQAWEKERAGVEEFLGKLFPDPDKLKAVLGDEYYQDMVTMKDLKVPTHVKPLMKGAVVTTGTEEEDTTAVEGTASVEAATSTAQIPVPNDKEDGLESSSSPLSQGS